MLVLRHKMFHDGRCWRLSKNLWDVFKNKAPNNVVTKSSRCLNYFKHLDDLLKIVPFIAQTPWVGDGRYDRRPWERAASAMVSLFDPPGGVAFSYLVIIKSMTHNHRRHSHCFKFRITERVLLFQGRVRLKEKETSSSSSPTMITDKYFSSISTFCHVGDFGAVRQHSSTRY